MPTSSHRVPRRRQCESSGLTLVAQISLHLGEAPQHALTFEYSLSMCNWTSEKVLFLQNSLQKLTCPGIHSARAITFLTCSFSFFSKLEISAKIFLGNIFEMNWIMKKSKDECKFSVPKRGKQLFRLDVFIVINELLLRQKCEIKIKNIFVHSYLWILSKTFYDDEIFFNGAEISSKTRPRCIVLFSWENAILIISSAGVRFLALIFS